MALIGNAAMLLWYDIVPEKIDAHDDWHTTEHFPERVRIPGFRRAQRWVSVAATASHRYFVVYEVDHVGILSSGPYLERLNHPSAWTTRTMPHFRGMTRGFCEIAYRQGEVLGSAGLTVRFRPAPGKDAQLQAWLVDGAIARILETKGITSAILLKSDRPPEMTEEQKIRGRDAGVDWVLFVTGYSIERIAALGGNELSQSAFAGNGAEGDVIASVYRLACMEDEASVPDKAQ